jgi:hypothetical protein
MTGLRCWGNFRLHRLHQPVDFDQANGMMFSLMDPA